VTPAGWALLILLLTIFAGTMVWEWWRDRD